MEEAQVLSRLRETCLRLPEVRETTKWGHPTFEAGKKMFAALDGYGGRACIAFRACPERRPSLLADERFFEAPYAARHGWVCLHADGPLNWREVETLLLDSYRLIALKRMVAALDEHAQARNAVEQQPKRNRRRALPKRGPDNRPGKGHPGKGTS